MMLAAFIFAATLRYESILTKYDGPVFEAGDAKYEFYAEGGISSANDLIYRIAKDEALVIAAKLDETEAFSRNGWREIRQTSSELSVGEGALVWTKKERLASREKTETPFRVNCQTTRTTYRPLGRSIVPSAAATKGNLQPLTRVPLKEIVPCCSGCAWSAAAMPPL